MSFLSKTQYLTLSALETKALAKKLGLELLKKSPRTKSIIIALEGQLGSGKTTFVQGLAKVLGIKEKITSPTFILIKKYKIPPRAKIKSRSRVHSDIKGRCYFYHLDCYRIKKAAELEKLGIREIFKDSSNIIVIEWADKIKRFLPKRTLRLFFGFRKGGGRIIKVLQ